MGSYVYRSSLEKDHIVESYFFWKQGISEVLYSIISRLRQIFFVHIKIILVSSFQQTLSIIHYQRPMSRLSASQQMLQVLVFK